MQATMRQFLTTAEAADLLRLAPQTLNKWRCIGGGPSYLKIGGRVVYDRGALIEWARATRREHTGQATETEPQTAAGPGA